MFEVIMAKTASTKMFPVPRLMIPKKIIYVFLKNRAQF